MAILFKQLDVSGDGMLNKKELQPLLARFGRNYSDEFLSETVEHMDMDGSGQIDYSEFISAVIARDKILTDANLHQSFDTFDVDKTGKISKDDLKKVLELGSTSQVETIIRQVDANHDGEISFEEFKVMMTKVTS